MLKLPACKKLPCPEILVWEEVLALTTGRPVSKTSLHTLEQAASLKMNDVEVGEDLTVAIVT